MKTVLISFDKMRQQGGPSYLDQLREEVGGPNTLVVTWGKGQNRVARNFKFKGNPTDEEQRLDSHVWSQLIKLRAGDIPRDSFLLEDSAGHTCAVVGPLRPYPVRQSKKKAAKQAVAAKSRPKDQVGKQPEKKVALKAGMRKPFISDVFARQVEQRLWGLTVDTLVEHVSGPLLQLAVDKGLFVHEAASAITDRLKQESKLAKKAVKATGKKQAKKKAAKTAAGSPEAASSENQASASSTS